LIIAGDINGHVYWIDPKINSIISRVELHKGSVFGFCVLNDKQMISYGADGYLCFWDIDKRQPIESIKLSNQSLRCLELDVENQIAYIGSSDNNLYVFDLEKREVIQTIIDHHENSIFSLCLLDKNRLISGGRDAFINILDTKTNLKTNGFPAHLFTINKLVNIPELKIFVSASRDKTFRIWDAENYELLKSIDVFKDGHINSINTLLYIGEHNHLITAGDDRVLKIWKLDNLDN
jgi:WD40 repeat protein